MTKAKPRGVPAEITDYIDGAPEPARGRLRVLAEAIRAEAPPLDTIAFPRFRRIVSTM